MEPSTALTPRLPVAQRAGDLERTAVCEQLSAHFAAGRLQADELEARLGAAVHATTLLELRRLTADLPPLVPDAAVPVRPPLARPSWTVLDVLAVLVVLGCLGVAALVTLLLSSSGAGSYVVLGFLGGSVAAAGGGALVHLAHRSWDRAQAAAVERAVQRPRIA